MARERFPAILRAMSALPRPSDARSIAMDGVDQELPERRTTTYVCDACGRTQSGPPAGSGLLVWTRGDERRYEEPPLCEDCATRVTVAAWAGYGYGEEEE